MTRIAVVGSYGNGKSTLSTALEAALQIPRVHATPMVLKSGALQKSLENCDDGEVFQLVSRRLIERVSAESAASEAGFISDGSVLHEFIYAATRFRFGLHPESVNSQPRNKLPTEASALDAICAEVVSYARQTYDAIVYVANERPLTDDPPPVSEAFRNLLDNAMLKCLQEADIRVLKVDGAHDRRIETVCAFLSNIPRE